MKDVKVTIGLYRHFKGQYYYVTGLSRSATDEKTIMVNYFNVCHPEYGSFSRPMEDFISDHDIKESAGGMKSELPIKLRIDNITGQNHRFEKVKDINFQLGSVSTEQLIDELRNRTDSPIHELDLKGLYSPVFSKDYVVGVPYSNPEFSKGVDSIVVCDTEEQAKEYISTHAHRKDAGIYKRTFIKVL